MLVAALLTGGHTWAAGTGVHINGSVFGGGNKADVGKEVVVNMNGGTVDGDIYGGGALANTNVDAQTDEYYEVTLSAGTSIAGYYILDNGDYKLQTSGSAANNGHYYRKIETTVNLNSGIVKGDVYGGGLGDLASIGDGHTNKAAIVYGDITVNLSNDSNDDSKPATAFQITYYQDDDQTDNIDESKIIKSGRIFGANNLNGSPQGDVTVNIYKTIAGINQNTQRTEADTDGKAKKTGATPSFELAAVYGGGNLANYTTAGKKASVNIWDCDVSIQSVYGGGNAASVPETDVFVAGAYEIEYVFGGGNGKDPYTFDDGSTWQQNNGADVAGNTRVMLTGGYIHEAYGGSNEKGTITGNASLSVEDAGGTCPLDVTKLVGAGKNADIDGDAILILGCMPETKIDQVFGGADNANVNGNVELTITSGNFGQVFGGNNESGIINGHIILNIEETGCRAINIDELYLGGNRAAYSVYGYDNNDNSCITNGNQEYDDPVLNVISCTYIGQVFGGGLGAGAFMYASPTVNINMIPGKFATAIDRNNDNNADGNAHALGTIVDVYGGGKQAAVNGMTTVNIGTTEKVYYTSEPSYLGTKGTDYIEITADGPNKGKFEATAEGARITGNVYGGGLAANVSGNSEVNIGTIAYTTTGFEKVTIAGDVYGGGEGHTTNVTGTATVNLGTTGVGNSTVSGDIYGGSAFGTVGTTLVNLYHGTASRNVFGGGKGQLANNNVSPALEAYPAQITTSSSVSLLGATITEDIYGGCNVNGTTATTTVKLLDGSVRDAFGGGLGESTGVTGNVLVELGKYDANAETNKISGNATVLRDIYGGSAKGSVNNADNVNPEVAAKTTHTYVNLYAGTVTGDVYGGGLGTADVAAQGDNPAVPGIAALVYGDVAVKLNEHSGTAVVGGSVFGCNNLKGTPKGAVTVDVYATNNSTGQKYAKLESAETSADPDYIKATDAEVSAHSYDLTGVFGGGNLATYNPTSGNITTVTIHGCGESSIKEVYGGGNAAHVPGCAVNVYGAYEIGYVYAGGKGQKYGVNGATSDAEANVNGDATTTINGGTIYRTFAGANTNGDINGTSTLAIAEGANTETNCQPKLGDVFSYGNLAEMSGSINVQIGCLTNKVGALYGGAMNANINNNITLDINGGKFAKVFGGNKSGGTIRGYIKVNVEQTECDIEIDSLYGCGNAAPYTTAYTNNGVPANYADPEVNIISCTTIGAVFGGGLGAAATVTGNPKVNINMLKATGQATLGNIGNVYGGGNAAAVTGNPIVNIGTLTDLSDNNSKPVLGANITGNVFGGGCSANVTGNTTVNIGTVNYTVGGDVVGITIGDDVYGAGEGNSTNVTGSATVNLGASGVGNTTLSHDIYGGSAFGSAANTDVHLYSGSVANVYGGGKGQIAFGNDAAFVATISTKATVTLHNATITGAVYGGCNVNGTAAATYVYVLGGSVHDVFGGGLGPNTGVSGNVLVEIGRYENSTLSGTATVIHDVYGGSAKGEVNTNTSNTTTVNLWNGIVNGDVYGGGLGDASNAAAVNGNTRVNLNGYDSGTETITPVSMGECVVKGHIFGGNNANGSPAGTAQVHIYKTQSYADHVRTLPVKLSSATESDHSYELAAVFGGGNEAAFTGTTTSVVIETCDPSIQTVYGGGNAADATNTSVLVRGAYEIGTVFGGGDGSGTGNPGANVSGTATTILNGGRIHNFYGGSNAKGTIGTYSNGLADGGTAITIDDLNLGDDCSLKLDTIYGAGKSAHVDGNVSMTMGCLSDEYTIKNLYGGAQAANIKGGVTLTVTSGRFDRVFGGNNLSGTIGGDITVNIEETGCKPVIIGQVFGGGNKADFEHNTTVNAKSFTSIGEIYGGGNLANIGGNANVNIITRLSTLGTLGTIGYVFGGGYGAGTNVNGNVEVVIGSTSDESITPVITNDVYGGSALGTVNGTTAADTYHTFVTLNSGTVTGSVYGGGLGDNDHSATVNAPVTVTVNGGQAANVFGANNVKGAPQRTVTVKIDGGNIGNVYGGGNQASYSGNPTVTMTAGTARNVFGGGLGSQATVTGNPTVSLSGGTVTNNVYGGGSLAKVIGGTSVSMPAASTARVNNNLFGGGSQADVTGSVNVSIAGGWVTSAVYGGGALASTNIDNWNDNTGTWADGKTSSTNTTTVSLTGGIIGDAYGGGLGQKAEPEVGQVGDKDYLPALTAIPAMVYGDVTLTVNGTAFKQRFAYPSAEDDPVPTSGRVFGCNNLNGSPMGDVTVTVYQTILLNEMDQRVEGQHSDSKYEIHSVYGGGNLAHYLPATGKETKVIIDGCDEARIEKVFGGGNSASVPSTDVLIKGSDAIDYAFGGGNGKDKILDRDGIHWSENDGAPVYGNAKIVVLGGRIGAAFSGSDTKGTVYGTATIQINGKEGFSAATDCPIKITNSYGAGRGADINGDVEFTVTGCEDDDIENVFAGSYDANIRGSVILNINSGIFTNVFGGNDHGGTIGGNITVNVLEYEVDPDHKCNPIIIKNLYGGGRDAAYPGSGAKYVTGHHEENGETVYDYAPFSEGKITVNIKSFTRIDNVYGGSLRAPVNGRTLVNVNVIKGDWAGLSVTLPKSYSYIPNISFGNVNPDNKTITGTINNSIGTIGNIFGGGDAGHVFGDATVNIGTQTEYGNVPVLGAFITGNVFGGGNNADIFGNTYVNICAQNTNGVPTGNSVNLAGNNGYVGIKVDGNVYGGGNMGSVGTFDHINTAKPTAIISGGTSTVTIMGNAEIGPNDMRMPQDYGHVFGAGKGFVRNPEDEPTVNYKAYVNNSNVTIGGNAFVKGSVYGGSENGHVLNNTHVIIQDECQIGNGWNPTKNNGAGGGVNRPYTAQEWAGNSLYECASWEYSGTHDPYDIYKDSDGDGTPDPATDGHTFYGNVFGGGSGYYPYAKNPNIAAIKAKDTHYADGLWLRNAGVVEGNTLVEITGGHVLTSVYGGNEQTDVLGSCTVNISGGTVGVPRTLEQMKAHPVTCYVFGAGKGDQRINFNTWTNVGSTEVNITGSARIYGSVFGGGEDGHVLGDAVTTIGLANTDNSGITIGTTGTSSVDGNVFGGGRGFSGQALTAGVVQGNVTLNIYGGTMMGSVFGGGRLASVGTGLVHPETGVTVDANGNVTAITDITPNAAYGTLLDDDNTNTYGNITINISGGTIGATDNGNLASSEFTIGDVFAGGKGSIENPELGLVKNTTLTISGGTVNHNVYGGGEIGSVGKITNFKNLDSKSGGSYIYRHDDEENSNPTSNGAQYGFGLSWPYQFNYDNTTGLAQVTIQGTAVIKGDVYGGSQGKLLLDWDNIDLSTVTGSTKKDKIIKVQNDYRYYQEKFANVRQTSVTINLSTTLASASGSGERIVGSVYGGAENGHVYDDASVTINKGLIGGHVFGGGKGDGRFQAYLLDPVAGQGKLKSEKENVYSWTAGKVYGNTYVTMNDGWVIRNVYGGGDLGSVGKGNYAGGQDDYSKDGYGELPPRGNQALWTGSDTPGTYPYYFITSGITNVVINGGKIGIQDALDTDPVFNTTFPTGNVFGSGRGLSAINVGRLSPRYRYVPEFYLGYVNQANVTIGSSTGTGSGPTLYGSVYGGGQDGHVRRSTQVNVYKGQIGQVYNGGGNLEDAQWMGRGNVYGAGAGMGKYYDLLDNDKEKYNFSSGSVTCATVVNIYGGTIHQNVYGGGALASVGPPKTTQSKLEDKTAQDSKMSVSYTQVNIFNGAVIGDSVSYRNDYGGNVYGASRGNDHLNYNGVDSTTYATDIWAQVNVSGGHIIGNVFGGGEIGQVSMGVDVNISGGTIDQDVYGGGALASTNTWSTTDSETSHTSFPTTTVNLTGGIMNDVYGGGLGSLTVNGAEITSKKKPLSGNVIVNLNKNVANNAKGAVLRHLYGANNLNGSPQGSIRVNVYATQNAHKDSIAQDKDVSHYHTGYEETGVASTYDVFAVYGGGNLAPYEPANNDATLVTIDGCYKVSIKQVYGGGNAASVPATHVKVLGTYEIEELFGGGNGKDPYILEGNTYHNPGANVGYFNYTDFVQEGSSTIYNPVDKPGATTKEGRADFKYGTGVATTEIRGGKIHYVYGGSNEKGNISTTALSVYENAIEDCPIDVDETYGGGKNAPMDGTIELTLDCVKDMDMIFGGARNADIYSDVTLNITNGKYKKVFGGNNTSGALYGSITVNIKEEGCQPIEIEELYGGGYLAPYSIYGYKKDANDSIIPLQKGDEGARTTPFKDPRINIISATRIDNIYGGGYKAKMIGSPYINVNMEDGRMLVYKVTTGDQTQYLDVKLKEYDPATLTPEQVDDETKYYTPLPLGTIGNIFGGGYEADVVGNTYIEIGTGRWLTSWNDSTGLPVYTATPGNRKAAVITGDVYGGGNKADVTKNTWIDIAGGLIMHNVYGGGKEGSVGTLKDNGVKHDIQVNDTQSKINYSFYDFGLSWPVKLEYADSTGDTHINITGGRIGTSGDDNGDVFGAGKGKIDIDWAKIVSSQEWNAMSGTPQEKALYFQNKYRYDEAYQTNVNNTYVNINLPFNKDNINSLITVQEVWDDDDKDYKYKYVINGFNYTKDENDTQKHGYFTAQDSITPAIAGSVYGGAEDGHVIGNTSVTLDNGLIGHSVYGGGKGKGKYKGVLYDINAFKSQTPNTHTFKDYTTINNYISNPDDKYKEIGIGNGILGEKIYSLTAGKVYGNTSITMNGGQVMRSIFGGGNLGSVGKGNYSGGNDDYALVGYGEMPENPGISSDLYLWNGAETEGTLAYYFKNSGKTSVTITDGTVGFVPIGLTKPAGMTDTTFTKTLRKLAQKDDQPTGNIFGGCRGKAAPNGNVSPRFQYIPEFFLGYVNETEVTIGDANHTPVIYGSVYGGGQDGHVRRDAKVTINNATIGLEHESGNITLLGDLIEDGDHNIHWQRRGTVYGAGSGIGEYSMWVKNVNGGYEKQKGYNYSSGSVTRKTTVDIKSGAHIYENVYGGGAIASVGPPPLGPGKADYTVFTDGSGNPLYGTEVNISGDALIGVVGQSNYGGNVYGASRGSDVLYSAAQSSMFATDPYATVNITGGTIANNVFGGGQMGTVSNNTDVQVTGADISSLTIGHDLFGGGEHADVKGNTNVNITGGLIKHNVYGGGNEGSVGTLDTLIAQTANTPAQFYIKHDSVNAADAKGAVHDFGLSWPYEFKFKHGTGLAKIRISGQTRIGLDGDDDGDVFGASKGRAADRYTEALLYNVNNSDIEINLPSFSANPEIDSIISVKDIVDSETQKTEKKLYIKDVVPAVTGSVYGGGEDGHVYGNTNVKLKAGLVGHSIYGGGKGKGQYDGELKDYHNRVNGVGQTYQTKVYSLVAGRVYGNTNVTMEDGYVMRSIYGGGNLGSVGIGNYAGGSDDYSPDGYGELPPASNLSLWTNTDFLKSGVATVKIEKGTVGYICKKSGMSSLNKKSGLPTGNVFGGCRGMSAPNYNDISPRYEYFPEFFFGYVNDARVIIGTANGGPTILGSVYGGGQDGHVRRDAIVTINNGEIGTEYTDENANYLGSSNINHMQWRGRGNVYAAGSGTGEFEHTWINAQNDTVTETGYNYSSGSVTGVAKVQINNGTIYQNVYGGGSLASIGPPPVPPDRTYAENKAQEVVNQTTGKVEFEPISTNGKKSYTASIVTVSGGQVGQATNYAVGYGGNVYGASRGDYDGSLHLNDPSRYASTVWTQVKINGTAHILGNVFGGGENGTVKRDTYVEIGGIIQSAQPAPQPQQQPAPSRQSTPNTQTDSSAQPDSNIRTNAATESLRTNTVTPTRQ